MFLILVFAFNSTMDTFVWYDQVRLVHFFDINSVLYRNNVVTILYLLFRFRCDITTNRELRA